MAAFIACAWHLSPLAALANQMWASGTSGFIAHTTLHHMNAKKRCVAVVVVSLVLQLVLVVSCCLSQPHWTCIWMAFACLPGCLPASPDKWRRPKEKWFRFAHVASDFLGRISGMFSLHFISDFLKSLGCVSVCVCVR